jgi:fructoselysine-6-P-deglycase FrlB-like protein
MPNSYINGLSLLPETYRWANAFAMDQWTSTFWELFQRPLVAVGSGGSFTLAHFVCELHEETTGYVAKAVTPLELVSSISRLKDCNVLFLTASGTNIEINQAFERSLDSNLNVWVFCSNVGSPISQQCKRSPRAHLIEFSFPYERDGFLATNALLAHCVLLYRAYQALGFQADPLPSSLAALLATGATWQALEMAVSASAAQVLSKNPLVVLYGPKAKAAAVDLESKMTEGALCQVQAADYRNFAHGRHYWLARNGAASGVVAFTTDHDRVLARATLDLIPIEIPRCIFNVPGKNSASCIAALVYTMSFVGVLAAHQGIDPANPQLPDFGTRIFHLNWDGML